VTKKYMVDWDDPYYPTIYLATEQTQDWERYTLTGAKAEIIGRAREEIADLQARIARTRALQAKDIIVVPSRSY